MHMTEDEICVRYRQAKSKFQQRHILADLNMCSVGDIDEILEKHGFQVKKKSKYGARAKIDSDRAKALFTMGKSTYEMASELGVSQHAVTSWISANRL